MKKLFALALFSLFLFPPLLFSQENEEKSEATEQDEKNNEASEVVETSSKDVESLKFIRFALGTYVSAKVEEADDTSNASSFNLSFVYPLKTRTILGSSSLKKTLRYQGIGVGLTSINVEKTRVESNDSTTKRRFDFSFEPINLLEVSYVVGYPYTGTVGFGMALGAKAKADIEITGILGSGNETISSESAPGFSFFMGGGYVIKDLVEIFGLYRATKVSYRFDAYTVDRGISTSGVAEKTKEDVTINQLDIGASWAF